MIKDACMTVFFGSNDILLLDCYDAFYKVKIRSLLQSNNF